MEDESLIESETARTERVMAAAERQRERWREVLDALRDN